MGGPACLVIDAPPEQSADLEHVPSEVVAQLAALEGRYSRYRSDSLVSTINARAGTGEFTELDAEMSALLDLADQLWGASDGLFDITSGPLRKAWDFQDGGSASPEHLASALKLVGWDRIEWRDSGLHLPQQGMEIDLGGLAKEYAADCVMRLMREAGVSSGMIELAGDVATIGAQGNGKPWQIGIQDPRGSGSLLTITLTDSAIATSGNYARKIEHEGRSYGHLLDPRSGWPVEGPASVSVIDSHCLTAGAVATVACLKAEAGATEWLAHAGLPWLMVDEHHALLGPIAEAALVSS